VKVVQVYVSNKYNRDQAIRNDAKSVQYILFAMPVLEDAVHVGGQISDIWCGQISGK
jgi:hypothetical protein